MTNWDSRRDYDDHGRLPPGKLRWGEFYSRADRFESMARRYADEDLEDVSVLAGTRLSGWRP
eukprot:CAMPEP_0168450020 /NCGR_PEP_ID=MMETSP0228-20121227/47898_1 /TAXON_ID=133427 /ORGANISM="Protoceratium reticulatum, Strain CCCM 535 (=CCMP 1889)" /LENGTH=61 /DNA_ID=CAMNT_0008464579 /DNA_START=50 /DNA_END=232 /DNA_ORIENTATION=+